MWYCRTSFSSYCINTGYIKTESHIFHSVQLRHFELYSKNMATFVDIFFEDLFTEHTKLSLQTLEAMYVNVFVLVFIQRTCLSTYELK